jgi:hypothetical protein
MIFGMRREILNLVSFGNIVSKSSLVRKQDSSKQP